MDKKRTEEFYEIGPGVALWNFMEPHFWTRRLDHHQNLELARPSKSYGTHTILWNLLNPIYGPA
jgi:hypothetical protein